MGRRYTENPTLFRLRRLSGKRFAYNSVQLVAPAQSIVRALSVAINNHSEAREQDVERALGQLGAAGVGHLEQDRRILRC